MAQTRPPDHLVVIDDSDRRHWDANRRIVDDLAGRASGPMRVRYLRNDRTAGASGAWNTGLERLLREDDADRMMVAILDDDDAWEPSYLETCAARAAAEQLDLVAADIVRHEGAQDRGRLQPAPDAFSARTFLVGNPGIQGSNIFARLGTLAAAGLFDEALTSATDRDLCIRIASLGGIRYGRIASPLVHHYADADRPRMSTPGSPRKLGGLTAFHRKYHRRMDAGERAAFAERAGRLFGWSPPPPAAEPTVVPTTARRAVTAPLTLIVGMTTQSVTGPAVAALLADLRGLRGDERLAALEVVLLENGPRGDDAGRGLLEHAHALTDAGVPAIVVPLERQQVDAAAGLFGPAFDRGTGRAGIARARTMLQAYVYLWSRRRPGAVAWILDDDMRLDNLVWRGGDRVERAPLDLVGTVDRLRGKVAVALGGCTEAPPLPFASCVRTQLVDAWHNFELLGALAPDQPFPELLTENMATRARFNDYYYDLSRRETDHLETPFWYVPELPGRSACDVFAELVGRLPRILAGEQVFRPLVHDGSHDPLERVLPSVHRGGNTFVLDLDALWDFPNGVPQLDGHETRRSDMVWSLLNRYGAGRKVASVPLPVRQHRGDVEAQHLDLDKLAQDIHGYAIYSALDDVLRARSEQRHEAGDGHVPETLDLDEGEVAFAIVRVKKYSAERLYAFQLSFHRAAGLSRALARYLDPSLGWWWLSDPRCAEAVVRLRTAIDDLCREYRLERLGGFRERVLAVDDGEIRRWLDALRTEIEARAGADRPTVDVRRWLEDARAAVVGRRVQQAFVSGPLRRLGAGAEGVVLTDGVSVFKCFDAGLSATQLDGVRGFAARWRGARSLYELREARLVGSMPVLTYAYEETVPYHGGHGDRLRLLLDECRKAEVVLTNIHPDNLVVNAAGDVKFVDYGGDLERFTEAGWLKMARRVWLSARHPERSDLKELMRRSLSDGGLPELDGLDDFLRVDPLASKVALLDTRLEAIVGSLGARRVIDVGCGTGWLAAALAAGGAEVTGYDPDPALAPRWLHLAPGIRFCHRPGFEAILAAGETFDAVVCSLVLCDIDDDGEALRLIGALARLAAPDGHVVVAVCNPDHVGRSTNLQRREPPADAGVRCVTWKTLRPTGVRRRDVHRPRWMLATAFAEVGLRLVDSDETASFDPDTLEPSSDFLILHFRRTDAGRTA